MPVLLACVRELSNQHRACARTTTVYRIGPAIHTARISKFVLKYSVGTGVLAMCSHVGSVTMCVLSSAYTHACSGRLPVRPLWSQTRVSPCICIHSGLRPQTRVSPVYVSDVRVALYICIHSGLRRACRLVYVYTPVSDACVALAPGVRTRDLNPNGCHRLASRRRLGQMPRTHLPYTYAHSSVYLCICICICMYKAPPDAPHSPGLG